MHVSNLSKGEVKSTRFESFPPNEAETTFQAARNVCVCVRVRNMPAPHHDGGDHHGAVLHAGRIVGQKGRVLDQHQFVGVVPVADLQGRAEPATGCVF